MTQRGVTGLHSVGTGHIALAAGRGCLGPERVSCRGRQAPALCLSPLFPDKNNYKELLGAVDNAFLVAYAIGMFIR